VDCGIDGGIDGSDGSDGSDRTSPLKRVNVKPDVELNGITAVLGKGCFPCEVTPFSNSTLSNLRENGILSSI
tara:strand:- start:1910 stop:2125 length:216 start_codon:yes stop_codon:yes gene_type:complete